MLATLARRMWPRPTRSVSPDSHPGWLTTGAALVCALLIVLCAATSVVVLRRYADSQRIAQTRITTVEALAFQLSALEWQAAAEERVSRPVANRLRQSHEQMATEIRALHTSPSPPLFGVFLSGDETGPVWQYDDTLHVAQIANLSTAANEFTASVGRMVDLISQDQLAEAHRVDVQQVDPAFDRLRRVLTAARERHARAAALAGDLVDAASVLILLATTSLVGGLFWRYEHVRRAMTVTASEQSIIRASEERFRALVQNAAELIAIIDPDGMIRYLGRVPDTLIGPSTAVVGQSVSVLFHADDHSSLSRLLQQVAEGPQGGTRRDELRARTHNGPWVTLDVMCTNLLTTPHIEGLVINARDVTERKKLEAQLAHQAYHDPLTGLANRALFVEQLTLALGQITRRQDSLAVLFLDLDNFKLVNDGLGHAVGDELLIAISQRLWATVRSGDLVARFGGDEFAILLEGLGDDDELARFADRLIEAIEAPLRVANAELQVRTSVGLVVSDHRSESAADLLRNADIAMYLAKRQGKGRAARYVPELHVAVADRLALEADIRRALADEEFSLRYQPVVDLRTGRIVSVEALVRWEHPTRGQIAPADFVSLVEETGLILPLGRWVLRHACAQAVNWPAAPNGAPPCVSVNLSARQLQTGDVAVEVMEALAESGLPADRLIMEITEGMLLEHAEIVMTRLHTLRTMGVRVAIDDFGTGYSNLSYLQRFPIDILKIDRSFVEAIGDAQKQGVTRAIIQIASSLDLQTVAEGIEEERQVTMLRALGCGLGQGYLFSEPVTNERLSHLLGHHFPMGQVSQRRSA